MGLNARLEYIGLFKYIFANKSNRIIASLTLILGCPTINLNNFMSGKFTKVSFIMIYLTKGSIKMSIGILENLYIKYIKLFIINSLISTSS